HAHALKGTATVASGYHPHMLTIFGHSGAGDTSRYSRVVGPNDLSISVQNERHRAAGARPVGRNGEAPLSFLLVQHFERANLDSVGGSPCVKCVVVARVTRRAIGRNEPEVVNLSWL